MELTECCAEAREESLGELPGSEHQDAWEVSLSEEREELREKSRGSGLKGKAPARQVQMTVTGARSQLFCCCRLTCKPVASVFGGSQYRNGPPDIFDVLQDGSSSLNETEGSFLMWAFFRASIPTPPTFAIIFQLLIQKRHRHIWILGPPRNNPGPSAVQAV